MRSERVEFPGSRDTPLAGRLDMPDEEPRAFALFAHCFTCGKDISAASRIARALTEAGLAVLRFDFTGLVATSPTRTSAPTSRTWCMPRSTCGNSMPHQPS